MSRTKRFNIETCKKDRPDKKSKTQVENFGNKRMQRLCKRGDVLYMRQSKTKTAKLEVVQWEQAQKNGVKFIMKKQMLEEYQVFLNDQQ